MKKERVIVLAACVGILGLGYYMSPGNAAFRNAVPEETVTTQMPMNGGDSLGEDGMMQDLPVEPAAEAARLDLATKLVMQEKSIVILSVLEQSWSDGCLGLGTADEMCSMALVDGFRVEMQAGQEIYVYRTNKTGTQVRQEAGVSSSEAVLLESALQNMGVQQ